MSDSSTPPGGDAADSSAGPSTGGSSASGSPAGTTQNRGFMASHKSLTALVVIFLLLGAGAGGYLWWLNSLLGNVKHVHVQALQSTTKSKKNSHEAQYPINVLLLGADHGNTGQSVAHDLKDGKWTPFVHLSDTIMVAHIPADRKNVEVVSIPRDTWVKIHGYPYTNGHAKINAAFSYGGPSLAITTVERLTGVTIDHVAIIDWTGFKDLTTALGGVKVYIPSTFYDDSQHITWHKGWQKLEGKRALQYVRTRHGLSNGDFGRINRQQNFLRETMHQLLSSGTTRNPIQLGRVVTAITNNLTVDDNWSSGEIRSLALSMQNLSAKDVQFVTAPLGSYATAPDGESIVRLAPHQSKVLWNDFEHNKLRQYLRQFPSAKLPPTKSVN